jgi:hypothetical protein
MEPLDSLSNSQENITGPYPESRESSQHPHNLISWICLNIIFPYMPRCPKEFPTKILYAFLISQMHTLGLTHITLLFFLSP